MTKHEQTGAGTRAHFALVGSILAIAVITLTPRPGANHRDLVPFDQLRLHAINSVGNLFLFMPLGGALALLRWRALPTILFGCALSTSIEFAQLFIPGRWSATDDILLNTAGTAMGYALAALFLRR